MSLSHLISIRDLTREEAILILDTAEQMAATQRHGVKKLPTLQGKTVVNLFFEDSTRTRISFETAAKRLSADVINFQSRGSSVSKGESLKDTALTLEAMGADAVMMLRVQRERMSSAGGGFFPSPGAYHAEYGLTPARFATLAPNAVVMHPGPMNRGLEICAEAADSDQSVIVEQVSNGVCIRMAALYLLLASEGHSND